MSKSIGHGLRVFFLGSRVRGRRPVRRESDRGAVRAAGQLAVRRRVRRRAGLGGRGPPGEVTESVTAHVVTMQLQ